MAAIYKDVYPHKMKTSQTLIANFKEKNIKYDGQIRDPKLIIFVVVILV